MIRNSTDFLPEYDLCIIGSGPSGMIVATELAASGLRICVIESGSFEKSPAADRLKKVTWSGLPIRDGSRERVVGGASFTWGGQSALLDPIDFERRPLAGHKGWPITPEQLSPYLKQASSRYLFPDPALFDPKRFAPGESPWQVLEPKVFLSYRPHVDFGKAYRYVFERDDIDLLPAASVTKLISDGGSVAEAVIESPQGARRVRARRFVLAAGAIENARILLHSNLGNEHDQVGRYFMDHPKGYIGRLRLTKQLSHAYFERTGARYSGYMGLRLREDMQRAKGVLNSYVRLEEDYPWVGRKEISVITKALSNVRHLRLGALMRTLPQTMRAIPGFIALSLARLSYGRTPAPKFLKVRYFLEMEPRTENRVTLGQERDEHGVPLPHVAHALSDADKASFTALKQALEEEVRSLGMGELIYKEGEEERFPEEDASHHLGTTRMGTDPRTSVVDVNLRVHGMENLYVVGGSVFPTSGNANPTMVMAALSIRLAEHLRQASASAPHTSPNPVLIIGAGKRVHGDIVPVIESLEEFHISGIFARGKRAVFGKRGVYQVLELTALTKEDVESARVIYVSVPAAEVPSVLKRLEQFDCTNAVLMLPTPVTAEVPTERFKRVWVEEDMVYLPWLSHIEKPVTRATFDRSLFRYHGIALVKVLFGKIRFGIKVGKSLWLWAGGTRVRIIEPRDYARGSMVIRGAKEIADIPAADIPLLPAEKLLFGGDGGTIISRMHDYKRVGLRRLLQAAAQEKGWSYREGKSDADIDRALHRYWIYSDLT